jgi:hypothetical protein
MVSTVSVDGADELQSALENTEDSPLDDEGAEQLWMLWEKRVDAFGDCMLVLVPDWFSTQNFGARRPFLFAQVEYDSDDSGAVLFDDVYTANISIIEHNVVPELGDSIPFSEATEEVDISEESDYVDDPLMCWIPRSQMTVFEMTGGGSSSDEMSSEWQDPSSVSGGVLTD